MSENECQKNDILVKLFKNKKIILYGASKQGEITLKKLRNIDIQPDFFCDSDKNKWGLEYNGLEIVSIDKLKEVCLKSDNEVVVIITSMYIQSIMDVLSVNEIPCYIQICNYIDNICDMYNAEGEKISKLKNKHLGKRCFILGNGPSLSVEDLEKLKNEITFASNKIFLLFDKTNWRPTYYSIFDSKMLKNIYKDLYKISLQNLFLPMRAKTEYDLNLENTMYFNFLESSINPKEPMFSRDVSKIIFTGYTVTYVSIQMAIYMGFKEIYLIGVDHSYNTYIEDGKVVTTESKDYFSENYINTMEDRNLPQLSYSTLAYIKAQQFASDNGVKIYNATRGGKLEVFPRVDLDSIF